MLGYISKAKAQDAHFSQYEASEVMLNSSLTGIISKKDLRIASQFRSQWGTFANKLVSTSLAIDAPIKDRWGIGAYILNNDEAKIFNAFNLVLSGSYEITKPQQNKHKLYVGLQAGIIYKSTKAGDLIFDNQYDDGNFDPDLPSGEPLDRQSRLMPELNYGIYYAWVEKKKIANPYLGFSLLHITSPKESFINESYASKLPRKWILHGGSKIQISDQITLDPRFLAMWQGKASEYNVGLNAMFLVNNKWSAIAGASYRIKDAIIAQLGLRYNNIIYRMSYDFNTSKLKTYSNGHGGIEFSLIITGSAKTFARII